MSSYDVALATMDDDGFGCAITTSKAERDLDDARQFMAAVYARLAAFRNTPQPGSGYVLARAR